MNIKKRLFAAVLTLAMILSMVVTVSAEETKQEKACIQQMLNYYRYYQEAAATDIDCLLYALSESDPAKAQTWASIMDYWSYANTGMAYYNGVLPDGLPQDNTLCIVVMGYALASDGSMRSELVGRLETALASAQKYPNAYIACTGGGTAQYDKTVTEAGKMARWLIEQGIDADRIIVEDEAMSTVGNALNTCQILAQEYPRVTHLALVTSDYHLPRSCLLFHAQALLSADKGAPLLCVAANAAYETTRAAESAEIQADNLSVLVNIPINGLPKPELSKLDHIAISGSTQCVIGQEPQLQVIAHYNTGLYRDVSANARYAGLDLGAAGVQDIHITYEENGVSVSATAQIEMRMPETEAPTEVPTEIPTESPAETAAQPETAAPSEVPAVPPVPADTNAAIPPWTLIFSGAAVLLIALLLLLKRILHTQKHRKAEQVNDEESIELPDDDSPLEYI